MSLQQVVGVTPNTFYERDFTIVTGGYAHVNTFNLGISDSFNTIKLSKLIHGDAGDVYSLMVFSGVSANDPDTTADDSDIVNRVLKSNLVDTATYTLTQTVGASGITDVQFDFNTTFSRANLTHQYTVVLSRVNSSGIVMPVSPVFCQNRGDVPNFTSPDDDGFTDFTNNPFGEGIGIADSGEGNYFKAIYGHSLFTTTSGVEYITITVDAFAIGTNTIYPDPVMPLGLYLRPMSSASTSNNPYGTSRPLTGPLTSPMTLNITQ